VVDDRPEGHDSATSRLLRATRVDGRRHPVPEQASGQGIRIINGDENRVDGIHGFKSLLRTRGLALAKKIEAVPSKLPDGLSEAIEIRRPRNVKLLSVRNRLSADEGVHGARLSKLLERVLYISGEENVGTALPVDDQAAGELICPFQQRTGLL